MLEKGLDIFAQVCNRLAERGIPHKVLVIGEGPGAQEDEQGQPFVGRSGQLLDRMLESVGIDSNRDAYVCNIVKCRPPGNRVICTTMSIAEAIWR